MYLVRGNVVLLYNHQFLSLHENSSRQIGPVQQEKKCEYLVPNHIVM